MMSWSSSLANWPSFSGDNGGLVRGIIVIFNVRRSLAQDKLSFRGFLSTKLDRIDIMARNTTHFNGAIMLSKPAMKTSDLASAIANWVARGRGRNLSSLSKRSKVAQSTIRRIAQGEGEPLPVTAIAISEVVMEAKERVAFLRRHYPSIGNILKDDESEHIHPSADIKLLKSFKSREPHNLIFCIAATHVGVSREKVYHLAGQMGLEALDEMLDSGLIYTREDGLIDYQQENWVVDDIEYLLDQIRHGTFHFGKEHLGTSGAAAMHASGNITPELLPELKDLVVSFMYKVMQLKNDPRARGGTIPFFCDVNYSVYYTDESIMTKSTSNENLEDVN